MRDRLDHILRLICRALDSPRFLPILFGSYIVAMLIIAVI